MNPNILIDSEGNEIKNPDKFMEWFSGSVAVDTDGKPKVFYHASHENFDEFTFPWERDDADDYESEGYDGGNLGIGFYFTDDIKYATRFGKPRKFYLKITKLLTATDPEIADEINTRAKDPDEEWMYGTYGEVIDQICNEQKYDGVIGEGVGGLSYGVSEIMVKAASQIKSTMNNGNWSTNTNNLFESFYHGTPDKRNMAGKKGIHVGTEKAATQALESRIGVPADGRWDGTREYGKTLLAGRKRLGELSKERGYDLETGYNCGSDLPEENYYPSDRKYTAKYSDGSVVPVDATPSIFPVKITGTMKNTAYNPHSDMIANRLMNRFAKSGNARNGYFYKNDAEDEGSISAVVPDTSFIQFEGVDYVTNTRKFINDIINVLLTLTASDFEQSYVGMNAKYKAPEFRIEATAGIIPTNIPLHIVIRPYSDKYIGLMDTSLNPPALVIFDGNPPESIDDCYRVFVTALEQNKQLYAHELVHLYDRIKFDLPKYRRPSENSVKHHINMLQTKNDRIVDSGMIQYLNAPTEINARIVSAIDDAIANNKVATFDEFKNYILNNAQIKLSNVQSNNPTHFTEANYKKIIKMIYMVYQEL